MASVQFLCHSKTKTIVIFYFFHVFFDILTLLIALFQEFEKTDEVLDFVTKLYKNGVHAQDLKQGSRYRNKDKYVIFDIKVL